LILIGKEAAEMKLVYLHQSINAYIWNECIQSVEQLKNQFVSGKWHSGCMQSLLSVIFI